VRDVADQGQDTRIHVERGTPTDAVVVGQDDGGGGVQKRRHVRPTDRQLAGPVVARESERRARRGRDHRQEQAVRRRCRHCRRGRPLRRVHDHQRARRQLPSDRRWTAAATASDFRQTVSRHRLLRVNAIVE